MARAPIAVRAITDDELAVLERALAVAATEEGAPHLAMQARSLQVVGRCECGCASVDFLASPPGKTPRVVADAVAKSPTGEDLGVIVWAHEGSLVGLEVYSYGDTPAPLPVVAPISSYGGAAGAA